MTHTSHQAVKTHQNAILREPEAYKYQCDVCQKPTNQLYRNLEKKVWQCKKCEFKK